jgi:hypothetical protein
MAAFPSVGPFASQKTTERCPHAIEVAEQRLRPSIVVCADCGWDIDLGYADRRYLGFFGLGLDLRASLGSTTPLITHWSLT